MSVAVHLDPIPGYLSAPSVAPSGSWEQDFRRLARQPDLPSYLDLGYKLVNGHREDLTILRWDNDLDTMSAQQMAKVDAEATCLPYISHADCAQ
jgi:hypothetical protein